MLFHPIPDAEKVAMDWIETVEVVRDLLGYPSPLRMSTRLPNPPPFPFLKIRRIPGIVDTSDAAIDIARLTWSFYGQKNDLARPSLMARTLRGEIDTFEEVQVGDAVIMGMVLIGGPYQVEEPETEWARFDLDSYMEIRGVE